MWTSTDLTGVEVAAALKNAYALAVRLGIGMMEEAQKTQPGARLYNLQSALFAQSTLEMRRLLKVLGGREEHAMWLPGPGDLYTTIFGGRTVMLGSLLGQGVPFPEARERLKGITLESVEITRRMGRALPKLEERGLLRRKDLPLICHVYDILEHGKKVDLPLQEFFSGIGTSKKKSAGGVPPAEVFNSCNQPANVKSIPASPAILSVTARTPFASPALAGDGADANTETGPG